MKNVVVCKNCNSENPFYDLTCFNCKSYLRERIYNIDLWSTIGLLIESPSKAFKNIIFSEHKNFLTLLLILISGKSLLNGIFLTIYFKKWNAYLSGYFSVYIIILIFTLVMILIFSEIFSKITKRLGVRTKFKDNFSIITYSFLPLTFGFLILFPTELILFGEYLFYYNPSPFIIKETLAYTLLTFETILFIWTIFLTFTAIKTQTGNTIYSFVFTFFIHFTFYITLYLTASRIFL
ncbi:MAG: hypothetical protein A2V93_09210 [Ignavibacteria bacterium RBG_16_34_14]|nr:MAG: hypothetical protein A2V93_09210 [Ignavibacteria bacterium RBG_16_34_14]